MAFTASPVVVRTVPAPGKAAYSAAISTMTAAMMAVEPRKPRAARAKELTGLEGAAVAAIRVPGRAVLSLISLAVLRSQSGRQIDGEPDLSAVPEDQRREIPAGQTQQRFHRQALAQQRIQTALGGGFSLSSEPLVKRR